MPVKNICPSKCQFSMPQITKARSLSALAAVALLAGVSYAVSKPVYNFACRREIIWLKTPFDRIASVRDAICSVFNTKAEGSPKVELQSMQDKYGGYLDAKSCLKLVQSLEKSRPDAARLIYVAKLAPIIDECLHPFGDLEVMGEVEEPAFLLEAYKLEQSLGLSVRSQEIVEYVSEQINNDNLAFLVAVAEFLIDNPESIDLFEISSNELIDRIVKHERYPSDRTPFQYLNSAHFFIPILRLMTKANRQNEVSKLDLLIVNSLRDYKEATKISNMEDYELEINLILDYLAVLKPVEGDQWNNERVSYSNQLIAVLERIFQEPEFLGENTSEGFMMRIINQNIALNIDNSPLREAYQNLTLYGPEASLDDISALEQVMCLISYAGNDSCMPNIDGALARAKTIGDTIGVNALSLVLEAQIKHSNPNAKETFDTIEGLLCGCHYDIALDSETWSRIALADSKLNYSEQVSSSAWWKFWA